MQALLVLTQADVFAQKPGSGLDRRLCRRGGWGEVENQPIQVLMHGQWRESSRSMRNPVFLDSEFGKYFKLNENGLVSLTRRISEVKQDDYPQPEAVVGTYNYLNSSKVVLFVRRINTTTGHVTKMVTREIDYSCLGRKVMYGVR